VRANSERSVAFSKEVIEVRRAEVFPFHRLTSDIGSEKESGDCKVDEGNGCTSNKRKRRLREETEKTKNDVGKTEREKQLRRPTASNQHSQARSHLLFIALDRLFGEDGVLRAFRVDPLADESRETRKAAFGELEEAVGDDGADLLR
jgi:hypothetical protein